MYLKKADFQNVLSITGHIGQYSNKYIAMRTNIYTHAQNPQP